MRHDTDLPDHRAGRIALGQVNPRRGRRLDHEWLRTSESEFRQRVLLEQGYTDVRWGIWGQTYIFPLEFTRQMTLDRW